MEFLGYIHSSTTLGYFYAVLSFLILYFFAIMYANYRKKYCGASFLIFSIRFEFGVFQVVSTWTVLYLKKGISKCLYVFNSTQF